MIRLSGNSASAETPDNYFTSLPMLKFHLGEQNFLGQRLLAFLMEKRWWRSNG
jgi:hypothetical protein